MSGEFSPGALVLVCWLGVVSSTTWGQAPAAPFGRAGVTPVPLKQPVLPVALAPDGGRLPAEKRYMPSSINEPLMSMTIQVVRETPGKSVYRSKHFEFTTPVKLGVASMTAICKTFESTYELVAKLPWGINPWPEDGRIFRAELFMSREDYLWTGAPEWSAALYLPREGVFRIPFEEVGLRSRGNEFFLGGPINNEVITHEVTHQMMHEYLRYMPIWLAEGLAEYTAHLPYDSGRYNVAAAVEGFKQYRRNYGRVKKLGVTVSAGKSPGWVGADNLWGYTTSITNRRPITNLAFDPPKKNDANSQVQEITIPGGAQSEFRELPSRYFSAHALVFYFMHFDGDGKATRMKKFFDAIHEERKQWVGFETTLAAYQVAVKQYESDVQQYQADWEVFRKLPGVENLGMGQFRFPATLKPPTAPTVPVAPAGPGNIDPGKVCAKYMGILLDGRTPEALDKEVRAAFARAESPL
ncbi:MAG: hypothetical protein ABJF10_18885 [Chthoniobacter sp.]|uniref:hypothetical protein n=1 Tax=Chthoniobacter sp. TaxID=2510640 RepID=UPI0032A329E9